MRLEFQKCLEIWKLWPKADRSQGVRNARLVRLNQPTGNGIFQFRRRIPQSEVRRIDRGRPKNCVRRANRHAPTGTIRLRDGKPEIEIASADQIKGFDSQNGTLSRKRHPPLHKCSRLRWHPRSQIKIKEANLNADFIRNELVRVFESQK